jgi:hypothetical protein
MIRSLARNIGVVVRNPKWTSYGALEADVFTRTKEDFALLITVIEPLAKIEFTRDLNEPHQYAPKEQVIKQAIAYFNAERFWESHEALESVWRASSGDEKILIQGTILLVAAFVHLQKDEKEIALNLLKRASRQLEWSERYYYGIDLVDLRDKIAKMVTGRELNVFQL